MSRKDKKMLFEAWFSFIPNDFGRMLRENPDSKISREVVDFCQNHYDELNEQFSPTKQYSRQVTSSIPYDFNFTIEGKKRFCHL